MDLHSLTTIELVQVYSDTIRLLKERGVIRTKNVVGDLAEFLVLDMYNTTPGFPKLLQALSGTKAFDATSRSGDRYTIKGTSGNSTGVLYGLNEVGNPVSGSPLFEFLVVVQFDDSYRLKRMVEFDWATFMKHKKRHKTMNAWFLTVTKEAIRAGKIRYPNQ